MKVSREGVVLIKSFEGFRPRAVRDDDGRWVIGYGHTLSAREGLTVGEADAELLLQYDLLPVVKALNERIAAPLNQHQFDALASFAVSVGLDRFLASDVYRRLNDGRTDVAAEAFFDWPAPKSPEAPLRRRAAERALYVADPNGPVHLADLLAAPTPVPVSEPPATAEQPVIQPVFTTPEAARAAAVASLLGEPEPESAPPEPDPVEVVALDDEPSPPAPAAEVPAAAAPPPAQAFASLHLQRYSPYAAAIIGPLPGFPSAAPKGPPPAQAMPAEAPTIEAPVDEPPVAAEPPAAPPAAPSPAPSPAPTQPPTPATSDAPVAPLVPPAPPPSPFPPMDAPLVLTPATEADFADVIRPVWSEEDRAPTSSQTSVLFEEEPAITVLRHETEAAEPRRFDWSETGAFLIMGGVGLAACGASAAAFRLAAEQPSPMGETTLIAWVLALIGAICVGVSSWNLYVRWGKPA